MLKIKKKIFLVSNMYPSKKHIRYGIFVKNFKSAVESDFEIKKIVLKKSTNIFSKIFRYIGLYIKILFLIFKVKNDDIIYVHFPLHMAPALWVLNFFKKNIVLNFHGSDLIFNTIFTKILSFFLRYLVKSNFIVVPSNYYKDKVIKEYSISLIKVFVYPSGGINTDVFHPKKIKKKETFVLGFVSNFIESKGWKILLLAVENILKNNSIKNIELIIIGDGPDKQKINIFLKKINIKYKLLSSVSQEELAKYYNEFNLFVFPTYRDEESLGLVGLEAMACGTSVVAGKVGGPMGYINDGVNSFLFKRKDSYDLERKIVKFYNLPILEKEIMRTNAIKTAKYYDCRIVNKDLVSFLNEL